MKKKRWYLKSSLKSEDNIISQILRNRGISKNEESEFLNTSLSNLNDPYIFEDMGKAVNLILKTINNKGKIIVYGDYDVDGITSTSLLLLFFKEYLDYDLDYYIPDRKEEGYGLNEDALAKIAANNYNLMITVDCGITAFKEIDKANNNNLKTIITDHHQPAKNLPEANSLINPHLEKCSYPFEKLAGVGVAFKLCQAIVKKKEEKTINEELKNLLDIVALGTVADIVSLTGENRIFVKKGLELINNSKRLAFKILQKKLSLSNKNITAGHISFIIAPPFNASGRMESANLGVEFLTTKDEQQINNLANKLIELNKMRQKEEEKTLEEANEMIEKNHINKEQYAYVLYSKNWHPGVIGIVASKLVEKYYKPVIMIAIDDGVGKGSARSIKKVNLFEVLTKHENYFINFGGHSQAAGLSIKEEKIKDFAEEFNNYLRKNLSKNDFIYEQRVDLIIDEDDIDLTLYKNIEKLAPFGIDNPKPVFALKNTKIAKSYQVGKNKKHLKFKTKKGLKTIAFNMGEKASEVNNNIIDFAFTLSLNDWTGNKNVEANIKDIKFKNNFKDYAIKFKTKELTFFDKRNCEEKNEFLKRNILNSNCKKISIYKNVNQKFNVEDKKLDVQVDYFTSAKNIKFINSDKLFFYSLPNSLNEMIKIINSFKINPEIYLLFGKKDYYLKYDELRKKIPNRKMLAKFYKLIYSKNNELRYRELNNLAKKKLKLKNNFIKESIEIFSELNLITKKENSILIKAKPNRKLDLSDSLRYNKNASFIKKFNDFSKMAFANNLFLLITKIQNNLEEDKNES